MFFGGIIGSPTADLAGLGSILIPAMKREGYSPEIAASVSASSSGIGPLIPPSSPMILYSAVTGTSLGALFIAGLIPGLLLGAAFMIAVAVLARCRNGVRHGALSLREIARTGSRASLAFGTLLIIAGGFVLSVFTPSEGGALAVAHAIFLSVIVYRAITLRGLYRACVAALQMRGELPIIVSLSFALGSSLSSAQVPQTMAAMIDVITLLILAVTLLLTAVPQIVPRPRLPRPRLSQPGLRPAPRGKHGREAVTPVKVDRRCDGGITVTGRDTWEAAGADPPARTWSAQTPRMEPEPEMPGG